MEIIKEVYFYEYVTYAYISVQNDHIQHVTEAMKNEIGLSSHRIEPFLHKQKQKQLIYCILKMYVEPILSPFLSQLQKDCILLEYFFEDTIQEKEKEGSSKIVRLIQLESSLKTMKKATTQNQFANNSVVEATIEALVHARSLLSMV